MLQLKSCLVGLLCNRPLPQATMVPGQTSNQLHLQPQTERWEILTFRHLVLLQFLAVFCVHLWCISLCVYNLGVIA